MTSDHIDQFVAERVPAAIGLVALYYRADLQQQLRSPEGRQALAAKYRREFAGYRDKLGWEWTAYLTAADAIEAQDWPTLGRLLRNVERSCWKHKRREWADDTAHHHGVLALARRLQLLEKGATP